MSNIVLELKFICRACNREFSESDVKEWVDEFCEDDSYGDMPLCPFCGSDNVDDR